MTAQPTCAERISEHLASRNAHIRDLLAVAQDPEEAVSEGIAARLHEEGEIDSPLTNTADELQDQASTRLWELPLGVSAKTVFRIELSTGGPADWYEVFCDEEDGFEIDRIVYHFADWFDHAQRTLDGDEFENAAEFARQVVSELVD